jgi:hypothetical protein
MDVQISDVFQAHVVGWQEAMNCADANTRRWVFNDFAFDLPDASGRSIANPVPYVADFAELRYTTPRPFYCTADIPDYNTNPVRPGKVAYFDPHNWFFFSLPNGQLNFPPSRISVPQNWNW